MQLYADGPETVGRCETKEGDFFPKGLGSGYECLK